MSIARTTPAQNPRGWARTTRIETPVSLGRFGPRGGYSQHLCAAQPAQDYNAPASIWLNWRVGRAPELARYGTIRAKLPLPSLGIWNRRVGRGVHEGYE